MSANLPTPKKNIFRSGNFWTLVTFILGIIVTYIFYIYSNKEREPVYAIKKEPSLIYDKSAATPKIKLLSDDTLIVNDNVYVASIVIWNNGGLEIEKLDVRKDFIISVSEKAKIIDYKILNQVKPEISKFKLIPVQNALKLDWAFFDPGFGTEIQLIYSGDEKSKIKVDGYVLGNQIMLVKAKDKIGSKDIVEDVLIFCLTVLGFLYAKFGYNSKWNNPHYAKIVKKLMISIFVIYGILTILILYTIYIYLFVNYQLPL